MKESKNAIWKKSILKSLDRDSILDLLDEISENGDMYGYESEGAGQYYQEYKELFDELSDGAYRLTEALRESDLKDNWDDMTVALLGDTKKVLGFDTIEQDYFGMLNRWEEDFAVEEAVKRIERLSKHDLIKCFRKVMVTLVLFFDIKTAHDCLASIVEELDTKGALLQEKVEHLTRMTFRLRDDDKAEFDKIVENLPQRMWVE